MAQSSDLRRDDRLHELLAEWVERREAGGDVPVEDLCRENPELIEPLSALMGRLRQTDWLFDGLDEQDAPALSIDAAPLASGLSGDELLDRIAELKCIPRETLADLRERLAEADGPAAAETLLGDSAVTAFQLKELCDDRGADLILDDYVLVDLLGEGGMGRVYKALHRTMNRVVAVKVIHPQALGSHQAERFGREVQAAARLNHPNIVSSYDAGSSRGREYLVLEYVPGIDLAALVERDGPLPVERAVDYVLQAARGLQYAHSEGIIHRDIKPSNLLLDPSGAVRVLDLGLARVAEAVAPDAGAAALTASHQVLGTVDYLAPEQALDSRQADERADVYSLGCTLYYLLHGRPLYNRESVVGRLLDHQSAPPPSLQTGRDDVPAELCDVFSRMVAKSPADRYRTMGEVVQELSRVASLLVGRPLPVASRRGRERTRFWVRAAGVLVAVTGLAAAGVLATREDVPAEPRAPERLLPAEQLPQADSVVRPPGPAVVPFAAEQARLFQQAWAEHLGVPVEHTNSLGTRFRLVPPGEFIMGTAEDVLRPIADANPSWRAATLSEAPPHHVRLTSAYYVAEAEVTQQQYASITGDHPSHFSPTGAGSAVAPPETGRHPVENLSWREAVSFCNALSRREGREPCYQVDGSDVRLRSGTLEGYRLPTEAEWEFACRAGSAGRFCFGDDAVSLGDWAVYAGNSEGRTRPVMTLEPNAFGLFDMHGGVWEWCFDLYDPDSYRRGALTDPKGAERGDRRAHRGGCWSNPAERCRSGQRGANAPHHHSEFLGLRLVLPIDAVRQ